MKQTNEVCSVAIVCPTESPGWPRSVDRIRDFTLDPCIRDREEETAVSPDDLVLNGVWAFTHIGSPSGLEVSEVELISSEQKIGEEK